ncbi:MAG: ATP-binding cassette domain-containing protein [Prosthecobacter sp.]|jgi:phospholipid/cholesterol/gamma-HCH transport system ATP-binding protein|uniref:ABC transporter ATP-binding protein n=1 Tax=Prosthecobacter sp. TaxID=1965333 RepID=UPI0019DA4E67|nr:ATP-binding cassette domain-containing protein [Prosthecobacter sp.]MBE2286818.1 ATP-binding cassette domain-containing protein [Prosthecobacter sp.]
MSSQLPNAPAGEPIIEVDSLVRHFGSQTVLNGVSFKIYAGDTFVIMGGSGCGKSTLLRHLIGTEKPTSGSIKVFGREITTMRHGEMQKLRGRYGMLFQSGALLQSLTVAENVALPLVEHTKLDAGLIDTVVKMKLEQVGLTGHGHKKPSEISGGMKKRAALARALALDPPLVFSDEPTAGLDPIMTAVVDELTQRLTQKIGATVVVVTHDMNSVFRIGTRIIMLGTGAQQGKIIAQGTPEEIRANPNPAVQQFINGEAEGDAGDDSGGHLYRDSLLGGHARTGLLSKS